MIESAKIYARLESGEKLDMEKLELEEIWREVIEDLKPVADDKKLGWNTLQKAGIMQQQIR